LKKPLGWEYLAGKGDLFIKKCQKIKNKGKGIGDWPLSLCLCLWERFFVLTAAD